MSIELAWKPPPPEPVTLIHEMRARQPAYSVLLLDLSRRAQAASDLERVRRRPLPGGRRLKMHHCNLRVVVRG